MPPSLLRTFLKINPNLPAGTEAILEKVLVKEPDQRYGSGIEFANAFIATLHEPVTPDINLITPKRPRTRNANAATMAPSTMEHKPQSNSRFWILGGFIVLTLIVFAIWGYPRTLPDNHRLDFHAGSVTVTPAVSTPTTSPRRQLHLRKQQNRRSFPLTLALAAQIRSHSLPIEISIYGCGWE